MEASVLKELGNIVSPERALVAAVMVAATWIMLRLLAQACAYLSDRLPKLRLLISTALPVIRIASWITCVALIVFVVFSPPVNTLLAVSASLGLAVGLGAQDLIRNLIAGVLMLFERPFLVGDMINAGGHYGEVRDIGLRATTLRTFDDSLVTLPNAMVFGQAIVSSNAGVLDEMVVIELTVPGQADPLLLKRIGHDCALASPFVFLRKPILVGLEDQYDKAHLTRLKIKAYVVDLRYERLMASDIVLRAKQALLAHRILPAEPAAGAIAGDRGAAPAT